MPRFVAAAVVAHRDGRTATITVPVSAPPSWRMHVDETVAGARALVSRVRRRHPAAPARKRGDV